MEEDIQSERIIHQPPSCVEFCPANPSVFVVGTYKLDDSQPSSDPEEKRPQSRSGRIELYQIRTKHQSPGYGFTQCIDKYDLADCAVLDLHFCPQDPTLFALCTSTSQLVFFHLDNLEHGTSKGTLEPSLVKEGFLQLDPDNTILATSFSWNPNPTPSSTPTISSLAITFSSGTTKFFLIRRSQRSASRTFHKFKILLQAPADPGHSLEAWTVAFTDALPYANKTNTVRLLTGGDDSTLTCHQIPTNAASTSAQSTQIFQDSRSHSAGVTAILPLPISFLGTTPLDGGPRKRAFVTGSYDESIRVFTMDASPPYRRKLVAELGLGGGVWRLTVISIQEWLSEDVEGVGGEGVSSALVLASCMHAGVCIIRITRTQKERGDEEACHWGIRVVKRYTEGHESMCYGADLVDMRRIAGNNNTHAGADAVDGHKSVRQGSHPPGNEDESPRDFVVVSTSFYDRKICVWSFRDEGTGIGKLQAET